MKRILILNGAGRTNGTTAAMTRAFTEGAGSRGHTVTEFFPQVMDIRGCRNCQSCVKTGHCAQRDDMDRIYPVFHEADVVVLASPVYFWDISGPLKTAVDRLYAVYRNDRTMGKKDCVLLMTSVRSTLEHTLDWYKNFEERMEWRSLGACLNDPEEARRIGECIR